MESGCSFQLNMMRMVVKMAAFPSIAVLLLCCSSVASTGTVTLHIPRSRQVLQLEVEPVEINMYHHESKDFYV